MTESSLAEKDPIRKAAEVSLSTRIRRSKMLAKIVTPLVVAVGLVTGNTNKQLWPEFVVCGGLSVSVAAFVDTLARRDHCQKIINSYANDRGVDELTQRISMEALMSSESGGLKADMNIDDSLLNPSALDEAQSALPFSVGSLVVGGGSYMVGSAIHEKTSTEVLPVGRTAVGGLLLAAGVAGLRVRDSALDRELQAYLLKLDNVDNAQLWDPDVDRPG